MARTARTAVMAVLCQAYHCVASGRPPGLEPWEGPFAERLWQQPVVAAERWEEKRGTTPRRHKALRLSLAAGQSIRSRALSNADQRLARQWMGE
jgi:hypothetical protein